MRSFATIAGVNFPRPVGAVVNMMPIITGDRDSIPAHLHGYLPLIDATGLERGKLSYLTVHESLVLPGQTQRRPGIHTDGTASFNWGGGGWGGGYPLPSPPSEPKPKPQPKPTKGIYMASSDGCCQVWDTITHDVDEHGSVRGPLAVVPHRMVPRVLYWMTDRTPHESLPATKAGVRQFFRLVADDIGAWWARHSTPNPFGVQPNARIEMRSKF